MVVDRDLADTFDVYRCLDAATGADLWTVRCLAQGNLDYGNSPRATPLIHGDRVYLLGAFGHLHCVELATGKVRWGMNVRDAFGASDKLTWGVSASPLIVDGKLIVNPGAPDASLVALDPETAEVVWKAPGAPAAFASFVVATLGGKRQLVGHDKTSLGGWDVATGERLWRLVPPRKNDYNVPTPIVAGDRLIVTTENNGTRAYGFDAAGKIIPQPLAENHDLVPDTHTPVLVGNRLLGVWSGLHCLDVANGLKSVWAAEDDAFDKYASIVASGGRVLVASQYGELLLIDASQDRYVLLSRLRVFPDDAGVYSHPAFVGNRLYLRGSEEIVCMELE